MSGDLKEDHSTVSPSSYCLFFQHAGRISAGKDPLHPAQRRYEDREAEKIKEDVQEGSSAPKKNFKCWFSRILIGLWENSYPIISSNITITCFQGFHSDVPGRNCRSNKTRPSLYPEWGRNRSHSSLQQKMVRETAFRPDAPGNPAQTWYNT
jgi:hypothetical protein